jgi:hypothetical protein
MSTTNNAEFETAIIDEPSLLLKVPQYTRVWRTYLKTNPETGARTCEIYLALGHSLVVDERVANREVGETIEIPIRAPEFADAVL